ncbi:hypothetical protein [Methylorubrum thiocyanatum]|uniref:hypothetical protein n=1 Tax=Methylorubrum thiocyanatum TaxID=47958 RepID=UPI00364F6AD0
MTEDWRKWGQELITGYSAWYWKEVDRLEKRYLICFWLGAISGFLATVLAGLPKTLIDRLAGGDSNAVTWLIFLFSACSTIITTSFVPRYRNLVAVRDRGRIRLDTAKQRFEASAFPKEHQPALEHLISEIAAVEAADGGISGGENVAQKDAKQTPPGDTSRPTPSPD